MKRTLIYSALSTSMLAASQALPCGGAFGSNVSIDPIQKIVVSYHDGVETYIFNPYFCQQAESFGLILPVPTVLTQIPTLTASQLYADLETIAAPTIETQTLCGPPPGAGGGRSTGGSSSLGTSNGTTVIQQGQVGIFDWSLVQATSTASFTDWLTVNSYPYQASATAAFESYVTNAWYFIAFKVSVAGGSGTGGSTSTGTGTTGIKPGQTICGNFGPISLAFPQKNEPVVPARIAAVSSSQLTWTLFTLASQQMRLRDQYATLRFSGAIGSSELTDYENLSSIALAGDQLTELQVTLSASSANDLVLEADPNQADYRRVETRTVYVTCTGGATSNTGGSTSNIGGTTSQGIVGGTQSTGGTTASGGSSAITNTVSTGSTSVTSSASSTSTSPSPTVATGGVIGTATTGSTQVSSTTASTGGSTAIDESSSMYSAEVGQSNDDGGCSVVRPSRSQNRIAAGLLASLLGLVLGRRKRRTRERH